MRYTADSLEKVQKIAASIYKEIKPNNKNAQIIALKGDLGSGKTTFVKILADIIGVKDLVTSPTFVIQKIYSLSENHKFKRLIHIDAYRLNGSDELNKIGFQGLLVDNGNLICIEWPENVEGALPEKVNTISFRFIDEKTRELEYKDEKR